MIQWMLYQISELVCILLDVRMSKMNGFDLHREIEKIEDNLKVCYITAFVVGLLFSKETNGDRQTTRKNI